MSVLKKTRAANTNYLVVIRCGGNRAEFDRTIGNRRNTARRLIEMEIDNPTQEVVDAIHKAFDLPDDWINTNHGYTMDISSYYSEGGDADLNKRTWELIDRYSRRLDFLIERGNPDDADAIRWYQGELTELRKDLAPVTGGTEPKKRVV